MAHFRGTVQGNPSGQQASRLGHKGCGLTTVAASWQGAIQVVLREQHGIDYARVTFERHCSRGTDGEVIYDGPVAGRPVRKENQAAADLLEVLVSILDYAQDCASEAEERPPCLEQARRIIREAQED